MNAIVSVTQDWGIGKDGNLALSNRADMKRFVALTCAGRRPQETAPGEVLGTVLMGRTTYESFPHGALKARRNVVLSRDPHFAPTDAEVVRSIEDALEAIASDDPQRVWLIGGESVYRQLLPHCTRVYVTKNEALCPADAFFPDLDADPSWHVVEHEEGGVTEEGVPFSYVTYERV